MGDAALAAAAAAAEWVQCAVQEYIDSTPNEVSGRHNIDATQLDGESLQCSLLVQSGRALLLPRCDSPSGSLCFSGLCDDSEEVYGQLDFEEVSRLAAHGTVDLGDQLVLSVESSALLQVIQWWLGPLPS